MLSVLAEASRFDDSTLASLDVSRTLIWSLVESFLSGLISDSLNRFFGCCDDLYLTTLFLMK